MARERDSYLVLLGHCVAALWLACGSSCHMGSIPGAGSSVGRLVFVL